ncbi:TPA: hypothetical protein SMF98_002280 [Serratia marcescens]|nr:hypothetical protein [Serratia marcescens]
MFGESGFTHGDLLTGHNQYVGRSLKVNGSVYRDAYNAIRSKLNRPVADSDKRMLALVERMETAAAALIVGRSGIPPHPYNEKAVIAIVVQTIGEGLENGRIIAERLSDAGYQTKGDKGIYSAWKRQGDIKNKIA